jgi:hypothetical protein
MIKKKVSLLTLTLILCLMLPAIFLAPKANYTRAMNDIITKQDDFVISQQVGWSDDFDHGNITESGWSFQGFCPDAPPYTSRPGNITAEDKAMRVYAPPCWSEAWRTSNVSFGSWAFDVYCVDSPLNRSYIAFVSGSPVVDPPYIETVPFEYGIIPVVGQYLSYNNAFLLYYRPSDDYHTIFIGDYDVEDATGWWHINITRDHDGTFNVYFNDTLGITVNHLVHTTSDLFTFTAQAGYALDNIVVEPYSVEPTSTPTPTPTSTPTTTPANGDGELPDMTLILIGGGGIIVVLVIVVIFRYKK